MRVFVLSALPAPSIAATNGANAPKPDARNSKTPADNSPFGVMLAATAPATQKPQELETGGGAKSTSKSPVGSNQIGNNQVDKNQVDKNQAGNNQIGKNPASRTAKDKASKDQATSQASSPATPSSRQPGDATPRDPSTHASSSKKEDTASDTRPSDKTKDAANDNADENSSASALNSAQPPVPAPVPSQPDPSQLPAQPQLSAQTGMPPQQAPADSASGANGTVGAVDFSSAALQTAANIPAPAQDPGTSSTPAPVQPGLASQQAQQTQEAQQTQPAGQLPPQQVPSAMPAADDGDNDSGGDTTTQPASVSAKGPAATQTASAQSQSAAQPANPVLLAALKAPSTADTAPAGKPAAPASANTAKPVAANDRTGSKQANNPPAPQSPDNSAATLKSAAIPAGIKITDGNNNGSSVSGDTSQASNPAQDAPAASTTTPPVQSQPVPQTPAPASPPNPAALSFPNAGPGNVAGNAAGNGTIAASLHLAAQPAPNVESLAVQIAARSQSGAKEFDIRLDPPELGRVEVRLSIDASGKAQAHMTADQPDTLNLLQKDSGSLTQALRDAGLNVANDGLNFSLRGQGSQNGQDGQSGHPARRTSLSASHVIDSIQTASVLSLTGAAANASLDIHV